MRRFLVRMAMAVFSFARWFVRTANGSKGYHREALPRSTEDYRCRRQTHAPRLGGHGALSQKQQNHDDDQDQNYCTDADIHGSSLSKLRVPIRCDRKHPVRNDEAQFRRNVDAASQLDATKCQVRERSTGPSPLET